MSTITVVTGTDTEIGKTIATAALAVVRGAAGTVTVVKPVQTGVGRHDGGDAAEVHRLTGASTQEFTALEDALAPDTAALVRGRHIPPVAEYADRIRVLADFHDHVLVEGAGGLLVRLDNQGGTVLDLAEACAAEVVVVTSPRLGTLNHTELTVNALRARGIEPAGLVIGAWPHRPGLVEECNADDLPRLTGLPVLATIPEGAGGLTREEFRERAPGWFA
ncbi:MAG: dethiobiotin synthase [Nocardioidaceae bacterium]